MRCALPEIFSTRFRHTKSLSWSLVLIQLLLSLSSWDCQLSILIIYVRLLWIQFTFLASIEGGVLVVNNGYGISHPEYQRLQSTRNEKAMIKMKCIDVVIQTPLAKSESSEVDKMGDLIEHMMDQSSDSSKEVAGSLRRTWCPTSAVNFIFQQSRMYLQFTIN